MNWPNPRRDSGAFGNLRGVFFPEGVPRPPRGVTPLPRGRGPPLPRLPAPPRPLPTTRTGGWVGFFCPPLQTQKPRDKKKGGRGDVRERKARESRKTGKKARERMERNPRKGKRDGARSSHATAASLRVAHGMGDRGRGGGVGRRGDGVGEIALRAGAGGGSSVHAR